MDSDVSDHVDNDLSYAGSMVENVSQGIQQNVRGSSEEEIVQNEVLSDWHDDDDTTSSPETRSRRTGNEEIQQASDSHDDDNYITHDNDTSRVELSETLNLSLRHDTSDAADPTASPEESLMDSDVSDHVDNDLSYAGSIT
uniref:Uncharacterized protein n=1 Tax=Chaetoceros debilis TaxID=122233 RepID=A0A7S3V7B6_9STRA